VLKVHHQSFDRACSLILEHLTTNLPPIGEVKILAIDGPAGAGKTTMSTALSRSLEDAPIVHMDELYRGWDDALTPRVGAIMRDQILVPLSQSKSGSYRSWDWFKEREGERRVIRSHSYLIVEGVGSAQRVMRPFATTMVWIDIPPSLGLSRVLERDRDSVQDFATFEIQMRSWQGREILHFESEETFQSVHLRFSGESLIENKS
jgi:hypothetical protein